MGHITFNCFCPVSWDCRIHRLHFCRGARPNQRSFGECRALYHCNRKVVAPERVLSMDQIELNCLLLLNWVSWNRTVLTLKLRTYAKLNWLKWNWVCMLNCIIQNWTVFDFETVLSLNWIVRNWTVFDIETVLTLCWIFLDRSVITFNCLLTKTMLTQNCIVWIRTVWLNWIAWNRNVFDNWNVYSC